MNWVATAKTIVLDHTHVRQSTLCCVLAVAEAAQMFKSQFCYQAHEPVFLLSTWEAPKCFFPVLFFHWYIKTRTAAATVSSPSAANYRRGFSVMLPHLWWYVIMMCALYSCRFFGVSCLDCFLQVWVSFFWYIVPPSCPRRAGCHFQWSHLELQDGLGKGRMKKFRWIKGRRLIFKLIRLFF